MHLVLKIQDVMASSVWGKGGISNSCRQFSTGLCFGVEPEPSNLLLIQGKVETFEVAAFQSSSRGWNRTTF